MVVTTSPDLERELVDIQVAMKRVGVTRRTINNWMLRGLVEFERTAGGSPRIYADTLWRRSEAK